MRAVCESCLISFYDIVISCVRVASDKFPRAYARYLFTVDSLDAIVLAGVQLSILIPA